ncbi:MAG: D-glycero-beta-D-manno-heptose 1,7-bisphosphate 7-phosphatase [Candidatus Berkiella sp.]
MKLIILDRDGVINEDSPAYIKSADEWHPIPNSLAAIALLNRLGYTVSVATNQSGLARGYYDLATLDAIHDKMHQAVKQAGGTIDSLFYCPHVAEDNCACRKPKPGLLHQIAKHYEVSLDNVHYVGDSYRDLEAGITAGATPILVLTGNGRKTLQSHASDCQKIAYYKDLYAFACSLKA